ncbi:hypothetical protein MIND_00525200 [Mycena indigotica]|uniref:non-specific serine/threonine protein kinase n=1 Tax=Mycena indigotica TaxID=2126181 RepID=A0A8H6SYW2_9AGAR|nr:uncharacterized protein MIND_00525200 [Mycena indigotica]KAF7307312.1 hypothetical protein MIND_00525200 [Mycena indigotica]
MAFEPGSVVRLRLVGSEEEQFTVIHPFLPFTKSVVFLANGTRQKKVVVKLYDPRYLNDRFVLSQYRPDYPWEAALERKAVSMRMAGSFPDSLEQCLWADDDGDRAVFWEEFFYRTSMASFRDECEAYDRLVALQGTAIPRLLGRGIVIEDRAIEVPAIVLEHIEGTAIRDAQAVAAEAYVELAKAIELFRELDVVHDDINEGNVLLCGNRAVIIDFGRARRLDSCGSDMRRLETLFRSKTR